MREQLLAVEKVQAIEWRDGALYLLDQRLLPHQQTVSAQQTDNSGYRYYVPR